MSYRALQRLRRERRGETAIPVVDEDESDEDEKGLQKKSNVFAAVMFEDDSDDDSDDASDEDSGFDFQNDFNRSSSDAKQYNDIGAKTDKNKNKAYSMILAPNNRHEKRQSDLEDLDTLLQEYKRRDTEQEGSIAKSNNDIALEQYSILTSRMEIRDLDIENVRRSIFGGNEVSGGESGSSSRRLHRHHNLFGTPSESWPRPPHYIGGGIGFKAYTDSKESSLQTLPWPYCDMKEGDIRCPPLQNWFHFIHSDVYQRDYRDLQIIQDSGDPNAMLLFIVHHPFVVEALIQISIIMYQMNRGSEGLSFLKRALWIFECAAPSTFLKGKYKCAFMDYQKYENKTFFSTLFQLIRVSYVGGLARTAFAVSQFLLSLDPLRDPKNVLLGIDHFAHMCNTKTSNKWVVDFVESKKIYVAFRDDESRQEFECHITDLPNWGFSYALALFNLHEETTHFESNSKERANNALKNAICRFPSVILQLLAKNEVDTSIHSLRIGRSSSLKYLDDLVSQFQKQLFETSNSGSITRARTSQAYDTIVRIFVHQNFKLWSSSAVLTWVYENLTALQEETKNGDGIKIAPLSPAIIRYIDCDLIDYEDRFQTMPADVNPFDPDTIALALNIDPNRRRLVQRNPNHADANFIDENRNAFVTRHRNFFGRVTEIVDPDLPLLELFWRSALPWAHVDGVPPANR